MAIFLPTSRASRIAGIVLQATAYTSLFLLEMVMHPQATELAGATTFTATLTTDHILRTMYYFILLTGLVFSTYVARLSAFKSKLEKESTTKRLKTVLERGKRIASELRAGLEREKHVAGDLHAGLERETRIAKELRVTADELRATADELRVTADERQAALERETRIATELRVTSDELNVALKAAKTGARRAAHDFGTPLMALVLAMDVIRTNFGDSDMARIAMGAVSTLVRLRVQMMDESGLALGEVLQPRRDTVNLREILGEIGAVAVGTAGPASLEFDLVIMAALQTPAGEQRVQELRVDFGRMEEITLLPIVTDVNRLVNIATNFISNACKHADKRVEMVIPIPTAEGGWRVEVHDDGDGVPPELAPVLFGPDMGAGACAQTHDGGTGVGLWSVKKMCECLGGDCGFSQSERLGGAMFWFHVPYLPDILAASATATTLVRDTDESASSETKTTATGESLPSETSSSPVQLNILLIDDAAVLRMTVKALLEGNRFGHRVMLAENGRDGLKAMKANEYALVFSDIQMPMKDGFEMTQLLRAWEEEHRPASRQPIELMSGNVAENELPRVSVCVGGGGNVVSVCLCCACCGDHALCHRVSLCEPHLRRSAFIDRSSLSGPTGSC